MLPHLGSKDGLCPSSSPVTFDSTTFQDGAYEVEVLVFIVAVAKVVGVVGGGRGF